MGQALHQRRSGRAAIGALVLLLASATSAFAQLDRGTISGTVKDAQGGVVPGVTVTATSTQTQQTRTTVTDGSGFYTLPEPSARALRHRPSSCRASRKATAPASRSTPRPRFNLDFTLDDRRADRGSHGHRRSLAAADRRRRPEDGRSEGHRAPVVQRPQSDWRARAQGRRHRRQLQQRRRHVAHRRRLQHQRWSLGRGGRLRGRRRRDAHPIGRLDDRRAERRHGAGSSGVDRQLHARVRARERRTDPVHLEEREQPLLRQRLVLFQRRHAAGQHLGAQPQPERDGEFRPCAVRPEAVRVLVRRPDPRRDVQGQAVLLRRAGVG